MLKHCQLKFNLGTKRPLKTAATTHTRRRARECVDDEARVGLPVRDVCALAPLCPEYARWSGMMHKEPPCSPRSRLLRLAARTLRTRDRSEPLLAPTLDWWISRCRGKCSKRTSSLNTYISIVFGAYSTQHQIPESD